MASEDAVDAAADANGNKKRVMEENLWGSVNIQTAAHQWLRIVPIDLEFGNGAMDVNSYTKQQKQQ